MSVEAIVPTRPYICKARRSKQSITLHYGIGQFDDGGYHVAITSAANVMLPGMAARRKGWVHTSALALTIRSTCSVNLLLVDPQLEVKVFPVY